MTVDIVSYTFVSTVGKKWQPISQVQFNGGPQWIRSDVLLSDIGLSGLLDRLLTRTLWRGLSPLFNYWLTTQVTVNLKRPQPSYHGSGCQLLTAVVGQPATPTPSFQPSIRTDEQRFSPGGLVISTGNFMTYTYLNCVCVSCESEAINVCQTLYLCKQRSCQWVAVVWCMIIFWDDAIDWGFWGV